jgi:hypothetical protein
VSKGNRGNEQKFSSIFKCHFFIAGERLDVPEVVAVLGVDGPGRQDVGEPLAVAAVAAAVVGGVDPVERVAVPAVGHQRGRRQVPI